MLTFNTDNAHARDEQLHFDTESHTYFVGERELRSVTNIVEKAFPEFDDVYWSLRKSGGDEVRAAELREEWKLHAERSRNLGTQMHEKIEEFYVYGYNATDPGLNSMADSTFRLFLDFARNHHLQPYRTEWRIFHEDFGIAGTLDFLAFDGHKYEIYDWKRSNKIIDTYTGQAIKESPFRKYANAPLEHLHDTAWTHYALQVSIYRYILEQKYGIDVHAGHLGIFHPDNRRYHMVDVPYLRDEVITLLNSLKLS